MKVAHPKHPKCPLCGRALYKSAVVGTQVKKSDPWAFCRNKKCGLFEVNQTAASIEISKLSEAMNAHTNAVGDGPATPPAPLPNIDEQTAPPEEFESVKRARVRIRELIKKATTEHTTPATVGIVLALLTQETGNHSAANVLIDEYDLEMKLGIKKVVVEVAK